MSTRAHQGLLQPTARQQLRLNELLATQRELYNAALEQRRGAWRWENRSVSRFDQFGELTGWDHPALRFGVVPARGTLTRLDRAFRPTITTSSLAASWTAMTSSSTKPCRSRAWSGDPSHDPTTKEDTTPTAPAPKPA